MHERVTITKNGSPAAILISVEHWEALQETLFWLSQEETRGAVSVARAQVANGRGLTEDQIRARFGVPNRTV
jgi:antitoxin YefM